MFKKDFKSLKTSFPLRGSEYKKFKEAIITRFGLSDEDGELLVPQGLLSAKFVTNTNGSGIAFFDRKGVPLWFQMGSDHMMYEELVPTVYTLWKRIFLPIVTTPQLVIDKLCGGADLMAPGVVSIQPSQNVALPLQESCLVCVSGYSRDQDLPPMAVGKMAMTSNLVEKTDKGKAVLTLHSYGDIIWERGGKGEPPKELTVVQPKESSAQAPASEMIGTPQTESNEDPADIVVSKSEEGDFYSAMQPAGSSSADVERIPPTVVDEVLRNSLLLYLNLHGPALLFPLSASSLYTDGILPFRSSSIADPSLYTIKQSSHKKLKPMLKSFEKEGILKLKEISGELNITNINLVHDAVQGVHKYRTQADDENKERKEKAKEEELGSAVQQITIQESWKPHGSGLALFNAVDASTSDQYSIPSLRDDVFSKYITQHSLMHPLERGYFVLDDLLKGILLNKKEKEKNEEFMRRDEGLKRLVAACQPWYEIGVDGRKTELRKGTLHPISISIKMRQGRKAVTLITNYEPFFLAADAMSEDLRKLCAAQTSVAPVNGKPNQYEVLVQGKQGKAVSEYLMGKGVPKKWIELEDTTEKKKAYFGPFSIAMLRLTRPARLLAVASVPVVLNRELPRDSLPIYPKESPKPEIVEAPTQLEAAIRQSREKVTETYGVGRAHLQFVVDRWIGVEHAVESRLKSLAPPPDVEPLFPGALWVGIAALSGSILAPKRSTIRRIIYPPAWGFLAAIYFLPLTTSNIGKYIVELEDRYIPGVAKRQKELAAQLRAGLADGKEQTKQLRGDFAGQVDKLTDMVREKTGLKVGEKDDKGKE